jgi:uncharacterized membrane protein
MPAIGRVWIVYSVFQKIKLDISICFVYVRYIFCFLEFKGQDFDPSISSLAARKRRRLLR